MADLRRILGDNDEVSAERVEAGIARIRQEFGVQPRIG
jgi:hypothetical protein